MEDSKIVWTQEPTFIAQLGNDYGYLEMSGRVVRTDGVRISRADEPAYYEAGVPYYRPTFTIEVWESDLWLLVGGIWPESMEFTLADPAGDYFAPNHSYRVTGTDFEVRVRVPNYLFYSLATVIIVWGASGDALGGECVINDYRW